MTDYFVGPGGNDTNDGLSWANRFLTLNGAEDEPVAAGDTVYVGPGTYTEDLVCDIDGSSGNPITYIGDWTGENTDGIGGIVRITGSDNDQTATRANCISVNGKDYRTFRGLMMGTTTSYVVTGTGGAIDNLTIEDCFFVETTHTNIALISDNHTSFTMRRCVLWGIGKQHNLWFSGSTAQANAGHLIENCIFLSGYYGARIADVGGITFKNCLMANTGFAGGIVISAALTGGFTAISVLNCIFYGNRTALKATVTGEIVEDYNTFWGNNSNRSNTATGSNSQVYAPGFAPPTLLLDEFKMGSILGELADWAAVAQIAGSSEATDDLFGMARPTTSAKKSWGPMQFNESLRETTTTRTGGVSIKLPDAARVQYRLPVTNTSTTIACYVQRETNYAGTNPQMIIKQPGVADDTTTDAGSASVFNELTTTLTPASTTDFVIVELVSNNTATSGSYAVYFDDLTVS